MGDALRECIESSTSAHVARLLSYKRDAEMLQAAKNPATSGVGGGNSNRVSVDGGAFGPASPTSPVAFRGGGTLNSGGGGTSGAMSSPTLGAQFRSQLSDLLATLNSCKANFIRCLKPNADKIADNFDSVFVLKQLQYLGIREVIAIRQQGFPVRIKYGEFITRYGMLVSGARESVASSKGNAKPVVHKMFATYKLDDKEADAQAAASVREAAGVR